jgi:hypothetical protein
MTNGEWHTAPGEEDELALWKNKSSGDHDQRVTGFVLSV